MTSALVSKAHRVCESTRFIRMDYTIGSQLGAGRFSTVRRGTSRLSGEQVAIKIFHRHDNVFDLEAVREEIAFMRALQGESNCVNLLGVYEDWESIYLIQELAPGGHLAGRIKKVNGQLHEDTVAVLITQILEALNSLHAKGIAHRDVKLDNLVLMSTDPESEEYFQIKLCDFGLCKALDDSGFITTICGTKQFWAPEIVQTLEGVTPGAALPEGRYDLKVDIWALGVVLFTLLYGAEPFKYEQDAVMYPKIRLGANIPTTASSGAHDLVSRLLSVNPKERPSAQEALQHPWLREKFNRQHKLDRRGSYADVTETTNSTRHWTSINVLNENIAA